jgi:hypothetical protein
MKKIILFFAVTLLFANFVSSIELQNFEELCIISELNKEAFTSVEIPSFVPYTNEIFNIYSQNQTIGNFIIEDKKIKSFTCNLSSEPTYDIEIKDVNTINDFLKTEDYLGLYNQKIDNEEIKIKGTKFGKNIKIKITNLVLKIINWFS